MAAIIRANGWATYNWETMDAHGKRSAEPWAPRWLTDLIGVDCFGHVTDVGLYECRTDALMAQVAHFTDLERLYLENPSVSDAGLAHLKKLTKLTELDLIGAEVSDAGLAHLKGRTKLSELDQSGGNAATDREDFGSFCHWGSGMSRNVRFRFRRMTEKSWRSMVKTVRMPSRSARWASEASASWMPVVS